MMAEEGEGNWVAMRSKLFVPGSRADLFPKAMRSAADAVCFDLEDSVLPEQKTAAQRNVREFLRSTENTEKRILVRINDARSPFFVEDLAAVTWPGMAIVTVPKVEDPTEIHMLAARLLQFERERGINYPVGILPTVESPRGLRLAHSIAAAHPRVTGLQLGLLDLFLPLGITGKQEQARYHVRLQLRLAAGEAALPCFDGVWADYADVDGFVADAAAARSLGFAGKSCIHPGQIVTVNRIFSPTVEELAEARRIVEGARDASLKGLGAFALSGRMVDQPMVRHAEQILRSGAASARGGDADPETS